MIIVFLDGKHISTFDVSVFVITTLYLICKLEFRINKI